MTEEDWVQMFLADPGNRDLRLAFAEWLESIQFAGEWDFGNASDECERIEFFRNYDDGSWIIDECAEGRQRFKGKVLLWRQVQAGFMDRHIYPVGVVTQEAKCSRCERPIRGHVHYRNELPGKLYCDAAFCTGEMIKDARKSFAANRMAKDAGNMV